MPTILVLVLIFIILLILVSCIRIVPQAQAMVVERLGAYLETWNVGIHFKVPFIDRVAKRVLLKEQVVDFAPQPVITKDNVTMKIDTVVFFQITDPKLYAYGVENPIMAIENLTATTLRNIIGDLELDQTLTSRETINTKMRSALDVATDPWGIKVNRVELKNIIPPAAIQDAMEKQMKAERERREAILRAEGEKKSTILVAEGKKQSAILDAEADKQAAILHAEAEKEKRIREAEGQAEAIIKIQQANADGIRMIKEAGADQTVLQLKSLEAFAKAADGKATKIIIPSEIQSLAGLVTSVTEIAKKSETLDLNIKDNADYAMTFGEIRAMMRAKDVELEPEENTYQEGSVFGKRFGNAGGVTAAVVECFKEMNEDITPNVMKCNGAAECKKALLLMKVGKLPADFVEGMACVGGCVGGPSKHKTELEAKKARDLLIGQADDREVHANLKNLGVEQVAMHRH